MCEFIAAFLISLSLQISGRLIRNIAQATPDKFEYFIGDRCKGVVDLI